MYLFLVGLVLLMNKFGSVTLGEVTQSLLPDEGDCLTSQKKAFVGGYGGTEVLMIISKMEVWRLFLMICGPVVKDHLVQFFGISDGGLARVHCLLLCVIKLLVTCSCGLLWCRKQDVAPIISLTYYSFKKQMSEIDTSITDRLGMFLASS